MTSPTDPAEFTNDLNEDRDSIDISPPGDRGPRATNAMDWEARVELRLREMKIAFKNLTTQFKDLQDDVRSNHKATITALEGRTRVIEKIIDVFQGCLTGTGAFLNKGMDAFINPTKGFIVLWLVTVVAVTGMTVGEALDVVGEVKEWAVGDDNAPTSTKPAPAPKPAVEPEPEAASD